jgi:Tfp pilus assembly protein PilX
VTGLRMAQKEEDMQTNVSRRRENKNDSKGFALISVLLLLLVLSGIAFALMYTVNTEQHLQRNDQGNGLAYYSAEAGMEKMMSDLGDLYNLQTAPTKAQIEAIACLPATPCPNQPSPAALNGTTFTDYSINVPLAADGVNPLCNPSTVSSGPNKGLIATVCPMTLNATAVRPGGEEVKLIRNVEIALIPVFQFGVFCNGDCSFFAGPQFDFSGRVHTNSNLFLASNPGPLTFGNQIRVVFDVVRDTLGNGVAITTSGHTGPVYIPTNTAGCPQGGGSTGTCRALQYTGPDEGSAIGGTIQPPGIPTAGGNPNPNWTTISTGAPPAGYNSFILAGPAVTPLVLPFVKGNTQPIEIIRRGIVGEPALTAVSRLYNKAQIRVLLSDDPTELKGGVADPDNVRLANVAPTTGLGLPTPFAEENALVDPDWTGGGYNDAATGTPPTQTKNLIDGYLRVEYRDNTGNYNAVTRQWLKLGFARTTQALPDSEHGVNNDGLAILLFQQTRDTTAPLPPLSPPPGNNTNYYPINMYDQREGAFRDINDGVCTINGVMNLVDIDVKNLQAWLIANPQVEGVTQNGYILYFSDRRGMLTDPLTGPPLNPVPIRTGAYGFDDVVNEASSTGTPNGVWDQGEAPTPVGGVNTVNTWGKINLGKGFNAAGAPIPTPNATVPSTVPLPASNSCAVARKNWVSGARHGVRLVNGSLGNLPIRPVAIADPDNTGGFTLASENPAYIVANYNANDALGFGTPGDGSPHASAAVIADTVSLLSNQWSDKNSFAIPTNVDPKQGPARLATKDGWYRVAIASGKNRNFSWAATALLPSGKAPSTDFGTDGGVHNFLRFLENWGGRTLNYRGSMVDLYYSAYATGVFKCCSTVYSPPARKYFFDIEFQQNNHLPPGTPRFQDVVNTGFRQDFSNR